MTFGVWRRNKSKGGRPSLSRPKVLTENRKYYGIPARWELEIQGLKKDKVSLYPIQEER